jgi:hypothetical protein
MIEPQQWDHRTGGQSGLDSKNRFRHDIYR